jgi:hypothetical protein
MNETRKEGLLFLERKLGRRQDVWVYVSKCYSSESSWVHSPAWWHNIPISKLNDKKCQYLHLLCKYRTKCFHYLQVPINFLINNLDSLCVSDYKNGEVVRLHLSASKHDRFIDRRGSGGVDFSTWLQR